MPNETDEAESKSLLERSRDGKKRKLPVGRTSLQYNEKFWVTATTSLILFLVISSQAFLLVPYFLYQLPYKNGEIAWTLIKLLGPFNLGAVLILTNYYKCVTMNAGTVPADWQPPSDIFSDSEPPRYCRSCKAYKPPRAHHCRTCKQCVLRMDHHCPWIANCVGQYNYASFIRFLAAVDVTCAAHLVLCTLRTADYWWTREGGSWRPPNTLTMTVLIFNYGLCVPTFFLVGAFSIYHFWCLCTNTTTIEGWEKDKVETMIRKQRIDEIDYPFDLGVVSNIQSVLGKSVLSWCMPSKTRGEGLQFGVGKGIDEREQYYWPPRDPSQAAREKKKKKKSRRAPFSSHDPFTYGNNGFNPALRPTNSTSRQAIGLTSSAFPPWHPDFRREADHDDEMEEEEEEEDAAQAAGVDTNDSCLPPGTTIAGGTSSQLINRQRWKGANDTDSQSSSDEEEEETANTMTASRVRRGSEGYEVRPKRYDVAYAVQEEPDYYDDDDRYDEEADQLGFDDYDDDEEQDAKQWDWQRRQLEEEKLRVMLEEEMKRTGTTVLHDPPSDWQMPIQEGQADDDQGESILSSSSILLPSQIMRRRSQWQEHNALHHQPSSAASTD
ncbi:hypothetical protein CBS101457_003087 [Exobasidium rhododendri]|nr:hypothetical protein CBS101457_003087 [Exobasidium rhododendri]